MKVSHDSIFAARLLDLYRKQLFESVSLFGLNVEKSILHNSVCCV